jgi:acetyl-CoA carboxylase biotin carboxyl carrier protein
MAEGIPGGRRGRAPLADRTPAANDTGAGGDGDRSGVVGRAVVGDPDGRAGEGEGEAVERGADALALVAGGDDGEDLCGHGLSAPEAIVFERQWRSALEVQMIEVEAHITGTVWKVECAVGDTVEEGDTVAILESMKMEMPVEAEEGGTVSEIRCEEGQAVSEGDTLVVLE